MCDFSPAFKSGCWDIFIYKDFEIRTPKFKHQSCQGCLFCFVSLLTFTLKSWWPQTLLHQKTSVAGSFCQEDDQYTPVKDESGGWELGLKLNRTVQNLWFRAQDPVFNNALCPRVGLSVRNRKQNPSCLLFAETVGRGAFWLRPPAKHNIEDPVQYMGVWIVLGTAQDLQKIQESLSSKRQEKTQEKHNLK